MSYVYANHPNSNNVDQQRARRPSLKFFTSPNSSSDMNGSIQCDLDLVYLTNCKKYMAWHRARAMLQDDYSDQQISKPCTL